MNTILEFETSGKGPAKTSRGAEDKLEILRLQGVCQ